MTTKNNNNIQSNELKAQHFKVVVVGDTSVGKSSLVKRFVDNKFSARYDPTIGVDFKVRHIMTAGKLVKMSIWDNSGCAKFRSIISGYLRGAQGVVLVYDVTNFPSYLNLQHWITDLDEQGILAGAAVSIIGNKVDSKEERKVGREEARNFAFLKGFQYMEVSALTGDGIEEAFQTLSNFMMAKKQMKEEEEEEAKRRKNEKIQMVGGENKKERYSFLSFFESQQQQKNTEGDSEGLLTTSKKRSVDDRVDEVLARRESSLFGRWLCW